MFVDGIDSVMLPVCEQLLVRIVVVGQEGMLLAHPVHPLSS